MRINTNRDCIESVMDSSLVCDTCTGQSGSDMSEMSGHRCESGRTHGQCPSMRWTRVLGWRVVGVCRVYTTLTVIVTLLLVQLVHTASASASYDETDRWYSQREGEMVVSSILSMALDTPLVYIQAI